MIITKVEDSGIEMEKRCHIPYVVSATCPKCGADNEVDYTDPDYLSYPIIGGKVVIGVWCSNGECENEGRTFDSKEFILDVVLVPVGP